MKTLVTEKIKIARESLDISQSQAARDSGWNQARISVMESKDRDLVTVRYLSWLAKMKVNLTALFDESVSVEDFRAICAGKINLALPAHNEQGPCPKCADKDHEIGLLNRLITSQEATIEVLQRHNS